MSVGSAGTGTPGFVCINTNPSSSTAIPQVVNDDPTNGSQITHLAGNATAPVPTIAAGAQIGTSGSPSVALDTNATDRSGKITIVTGSTPGTAGVIATVTFGTAHLKSSYVFLSPADSATSGLWATQKVGPIPVALTGFSVNFAVADSAQHTWNISYLVDGI